MNDAPALEYEFFAPPRIVFGWGQRRRLGAIARTLSPRAFVVWGSRTLEVRGVSAELRASLVEAGVAVEDLVTLTREPEVEDVDRAAARLRAEGATSADLLVAVGGGSAIDLAKAAAAMATNDQSNTVVDYLEGVGRGLKISRPPLAVLAMPTTAGTGSEATKNAVISSYDPPFKKSLRSEMMLPRVALVDPELTVSAPAAITMHSGMDAITQLIESYVSRRRKPIPRALAIQGLMLAAPAIVKVVREPDCRQAREAMAQAALLSGMALANSGLGMAHGVAAALGIECRVPHGLACAVMLPVALRVNRSSCAQDLAELAVPLGVTPRATASATAEAVVEHVEQLAAEVGVPQRLRAIGVRQEQIPALVRGSRGNSMDGNPRSLSDAELAEILEEML